MSTSSQTSHDLSRFAREFAAKMALLNQSGKYVTEHSFSQEAGLQRSAISKILRGATKTPDETTIRKIVEYFNDNGIPWNLNEALAMAGYKGYERFLPQRLTLTSEVYPAIMYYLQVFDAVLIGEDGRFSETDYSNKIGDIPLSLTTKGFVNIEEYEDYIVIVQMIGAIEPNTCVMLRIDGKLVLREVTDPQEVVDPDITIVGTVTGYYTTNDPHKVTVKPKPKRK